MSTFALKSHGPDIIKEFGLHLLKTTRPLCNRLTGFVIGHVLLSYAITYYQMKNFEHIRFKMLQQQKEDIQKLQQIKQISKKSLSD